jgi:beta-glucosidase
MEGGHAVADVLFGDVNPSAKSAGKFSARRGPGAALLCADADGPSGAWRPEPFAANAPEKFLSRYLDEENSALFPFGWGLSYTRFSYGQPTVNKAQVSLGRCWLGRGQA